MVKDTNEKMDKKKLRISVDEKIEKGHKSQTCFVCGRRLDKIENGTFLWHCWWCGIEYFERLNDLGGSVGFFIIKDPINFERCKLAVRDIDLKTKLLKSKFKTKDGMIYRVDEKA